MRHPFPEYSSQSTELVKSIFANARRDINEKQPSASRGGTVSVSPRTSGI
ncbi:hypothetical protein AB0X98_02195 [Rothia koreensis]